MKSFKLIPILSEEDKRRFYKFISQPNQNGCRNWTGYISETGYGRFRINNTQYSPHRIAYFLYYNQIDSSLLVLHKPLICNNSRCVEPLHLYQGTHKDNAVDMIIDGNGKWQKMSYDIANEIRLKYASGLTQEDLAIQYNICNSTISSIVLNKTFVDDSYTPLRKFKIKREVGTGSITYQKVCNKYQARLKNKHIGLFNSYEEAEQHLNSITKLKLGEQS